MKFGPEHNAKGVAILNAITSLSSFTDCGNPIECENRFTEIQHLVDLLSKDLDELSNGGGNIPAAGNIQELETIEGIAKWDCNNIIARLDLNKNVRVETVNPKVTTSLTLIVINSGGILEFSRDFLFPGGYLPQVSSDKGSIDIFKFDCDGQIFYLQNKLSDLKQEIL